MSEYKLIPRRNNTSFQYMKDGKFIKGELVPDNIKAVLQPGMVVSDSVEGVIPQQTVANWTPNNTDLDRVCLICGQPKERQRFVNMHMVALCDEHYQTMSLGKIAQHLNAKLNPAATMDGEHLEN
jgi:hypothetical protein